MTNIRAKAPHRAPSSVPPDARARRRLVAVTATTILLAGCLSGREEAGSPAPGAGGVGGVLAERPAGTSREQLIGRWGVASFRKEGDRQRVGAMARSFCRQPYVIAAGPNDGVMMHVADDSKLYELRLKGGTDGKTYLGFEAPPGHPQDREIVSVTRNELVMRFVDPDAANRYGTFIYARCS